MTGRERLVAVARGAQVDQRPVIAMDPPADGLVVSPSEVSAALVKHPDSAVLARVVSPLGRDRSLVRALAEDPDAGSRRLAECAEGVRRDISAALDAGADGVCYLLDGAYPAVTTPMEYGGHFLELDRQLLEEVSAARFNLLFVCGETEPYVEFVSDLPAHAFAWDARSGVSVDAVRLLRSGALAAEDDGAEIALGALCREEVRA